VIINAFNTVGKLAAINDPVAERAVVGVSLTEPSVVDDKQFNSDIGAAASYLFQALLPQK
jgi:hypothetical protein